MAMVGLAFCISELPDADRRECAKIVAGLGGVCLLEAGFVPASSFSGVRPGYSYKTGEEGLGYYRDSSSSSTSAPASVGDEWTTSPVDKVTHRVRRDDCAAAVQAASNFDEPTAQTVSMRWVRACRKVSSTGALPTVNDFQLFIAPLLWKRVEALDGLLFQVLAQLADIEPKGLGRASGTCRAWRRAAFDERIWERTCVQSRFPLLRVLKTAPGCQMTWRQLYTQRVGAVRTATRAPAAVPPPARSNYLIGIELGVVDRNQGLETTLHTSTQELAPAGSSTLCSAINLTSPPYIPNSRGGEAYASLLLIRKSDSKVLVLDNYVAVDDTEFEGSRNHSYFTDIWVQLDLGLRDGVGSAFLRLNTAEDPVPHCGGAGPPAYEYDAGSRTSKFVCSCGHVNVIGDQNFELREWTLDLHVLPSIALEHGDFPIASVDDLLLAVELPSAAYRWV
jgi:hypothetical protein